MSFLFKSKKAPPPGLTSATRDIHTSDGTPQATGLTNGLPEKSGSRGAEQTSQNASVNNSLNSLPENSARPDAQWARRDRADSDIGVSMIVPFAVPSTDNITVGRLEEP